MLHINLETCSSTQSYLKEEIQKDPSCLQKDVIVTTKNQTSGQGRGENKWHHFPKAISMSCLLPQISPVTVAPLQIGLLISKFFEAKFNKKIFLKWPNDLMTSENKKVGGIICQLEKERIIAGIGINLFKNNEYSKMSFQCDGLDLKDDDILAEDLSLDLYKYLKLHFKKSFSTNEWNRYCYHLGKTVEIKDQFIIESGDFVGISPNGEALLNQNGTIKKVLTGSLLIR